MPMQNKLLHFYLSDPIKILQEEFSQSPGLDLLELVAYLASHILLLSLTTNILIFFNQEKLSKILLTKGSFFC